MPPPPPRGKKVHREKSRVESDHSTVWHGTNQGTAMGGIQSLFIK